LFYSGPEEAAAIVGLYKPSKVTTVSLFGQQERKFRTPPRTTDLKLGAQLLLASLYLQHWPRLNNVALFCSLSAAV